MMIAPALQVPRAAGHRHDRSKPVAPLNTTATTAAIKASTAGTATAVLAALIELATGIHGIVFGLVIVLMVLDGCLGALRADRAGTYKMDADRRGLRVRVATLLVVAVCFVIDGLLLSISQMTNLWPGVAEVGWATIAALSWAIRMEVRSVYRHSVAIFGRKDAPQVLQVAADGMGAISDMAADTLGAAMRRRGGDEGEAP
jgi:hypothetical protein